MLKTAWEPSTDIPKEQIVATSNEILARPDLPIQVREEIFWMNTIRPLDTLPVSRPDYCPPTAATLPVRQRRVVG